MKSILNIAKAHALSIGLGLIATSGPLLAQTLGTPATPATPAAPALITDPKAKALFEQSIETFKNLKSLTVTYSMAGSSALIQFSAPDKIKVTFLDQKGDLAGFKLYTATEVITLQKPVDDYEYTTTLRPASPEGQVARARIGTSDVGTPVFASFLAGLSPFAEGGPFKASSYTMGPRTIDEGMNLISIVVTSPKNDEHPEMTFTFYIGQQDHWIHKTEMGVKRTDGGSLNIVETYKNLQANTELPAGTFDFTPPAGAVKVTQFSIMRAKVGELPHALPVGAKDIDGKEITFDQFKGKVTLVDFWATWCGPCKAELPNVKANYTKYHDKGFEVVGISLDQNTTHLVKYIKENGMPWRQVIDGFWTGPIATTYHVQSIPATILLGKDGKIAAIGARGDALEPAIQAALAK